MYLKNMILQNIHGHIMLYSFSKTTANLELIVILYSQWSNPKLLLCMRFNPLHGGAHKFLSTKPILSPQQVTTVHFGRADAFLTYVAQTLRILSADTAMTLKFQMWNEIRMNFPFFFNALVASFDISKSEHHLMSKTSTLCFCLVVIMPLREKWNQGNYTW